MQKRKKSVHVGEVASFILATVGSAVGLGNLWRWPSLCFRHGGLAFLIPYLIAIVFVGLPLLMLEFSLGRVYQAGDIQAFAKIHPRLAGIGIGSIFSAGTVIGYYVLILGWALWYFFQSFQSRPPWGTDLDTAVTYLLGDVAHYFDWVDNDKHGISGEIYGMMTIIWIFIYFAIFRGPKTLGKIVWVTALLPVLTIIVLVIVGATLDGADIGVKAFLGTFDGEALSKGPAWSEAVSQTFFTLSVCFGIMTVYSSFNKRNSNVVADSIIVAAADTTVSILAGFAVFAVLGYFAKAQGVEVGDLSISGVILAFATLPTALNTLPTGASNVFSILFFLTLLLLGIDSAFSLVEAFCVALNDSRTFSRVPRWLAVLLCCGGAWLFGLLYASYAGLIALDTIDYYLNNYAMISIAFFECIAVGYFYDYKEQVKRIGWKSVIVLPFGLLVATVTGIVIAILGSDDGSYAAVLGVGLAVLIAAGTCALAYGVANPIPRRSRRRVESDDGKALVSHTVMDYLFMHNTNAFRRDINAIIMSEDTSQLSLPWVWGFLVKFVLPPVFLILLGININYVVNNCDDNGENCGYEGYSAPWQGLGAFFGIFPVFMVLVGLLFPGLYTPLLPSDEDDPENRIERKQQEKTKQIEMQLQQAARSGRVDPAAVENASPQLQEAMYRAASGRTAVPEWVVAEAAAKSGRFVPAQLQSSRSAAYNPNAPRAAPPMLAKARSSNV